MLATREELEEEEAAEEARLADSIDSLMEELHSEEDRRRRAAAATPEGRRAHRLMRQRALDRLRQLDEDGWDGGGAAYREGNDNANANGRPPPLLQQHRWEEAEPKRWWNAVPPEKLAVPPVRSPPRRQLLTPVRRRPSVTPKW